MSKDSIEHFHGPTNECQLAVDLALEHAAVTLEALTFDVSPEYAATLVRGFKTGVPPAVEDDDKQELRCPNCHSEDDFKIAASVWVTVHGSDALEIVDEGGGREYGSEESCRCDACSYIGTLGEFYKQDQD